MRPFLWLWASRDHSIRDCKGKHRTCGWSRNGKTVRGGLNLIKNDLRNPASDKVFSVWVWQSSHKPGMDIYANYREDKQASQLFSCSLQGTSLESLVIFLKAPSVIWNCAVSSVREIVISSLRLSVISRQCRWFHSSLCHINKTHWGKLKYSVQHATVSFYVDGWMLEFMLTLPCWQTHFSWASWDHPT